MRRIPQQFLRDWRIRTLVPVVVINLAAFAALYGLMYHFAVSNLIHTQKVAGAVLLDELEFTFPDMMRDHTGRALRARIDREAAVHNLADVNLFDGNGRPVLATVGEPSPSLRSAVESALAGSPDTRWIVAPGERTLLIGIRSLSNRESCHECHASASPRLGALQMSIDLTSLMNDTRQRVRSRFTLAGAAWLALLGFMFWAGGVVIGRPLRRIRNSLPVDDSPGGQDLDALAVRVHETIWSMIAQQRQRDADITRQLARAQQLAALGELAAGLTHEIKNPLSGVIAALELCREEPNANAELFEQMLGELRRVTGTLDSLLRLARPQAPQRSNTDLGRVVRDLTSIFGARFRRQGIDLEVQTADGLPTLPLDPSLMAQLVVNLLTNGFQASARGGKVSVFVTPFPRRDGVVFVVADNGSGIAPDHLQRIFDPFFTTKDDGTGLGLAICRQIVTQHGGTISVESEMGKGTRVIVLLPGTRAEQMEERHGLAAAG